MAFALLKLMKSRSFFVRVGRNGSIYALKVPVFVLHGQRVVISIPASASKVASLAYAESNFPKTVAGGVRAVEFDACPASEPASTYSGTVGVATEFSGGIVVAHPACVPIDVWSRAATKPVRATLALGRTC